MHIGVKALIGVGSLGAIGGTGATIYHFSSGESIESYLTKNNKNKVFLTSSTPDLQAILTAYEKSTRFKPQDKDGKAIDKEKLAEWCQEAIKGKYYGADDKTFKGVDSWCYIDTKSFADRLKSNGNKKVSAQASTESDWTTAWTNYKAGRNDAKLKITDTAKKAHLEGEDQTNGAKALSEWCNEKTKIKFYVDDAEAEFTRFDKWCPKVNA